MPTTKKQIKEEKTKKVAEKKVAEKTLFYQAVGRRKEASARVRLYVVSDGEVVISGHAIKKGDILINNRPVEKYFAGEVYKKIYLEPFRITNTVGRFAISSIVVGGGLSGQAGAFVHGVARVLEKVDKGKFRPVLKKHGFMTRDPRTKERRKAGFAQKARAKKQSPKR